MSLFRVYVKSIRYDDWGSPRLETEDERLAISTAYREFDDEGMYAIVSKDDEPYFIDYYYVSDNKYTHEAVARHFSGRTGIEWNPTEKEN